MGLRELNFEIPPFIWCKIFSFCFSPDQLNQISALVCRKNQIHNNKIASKFKVEKLIPANAKQKNMAI